MFDTIIIVFKLSEMIKNLDGSEAPEDRVAHVDPLLPIGSGRVR